MFKIKCLNARTHSFMWLFFITKEYQNFKNITIHINLLLSHKLFKRNPTLVTTSTGPGIESGTSPNVGCSIPIELSKSTSCHVRNFYIPCIWIFLNIGSPTIYMWWSNCRLSSHNSCLEDGCDFETNFHNLVLQNTQGRGDLIYVEARSSRSRIDFVGIVWDFAPLTLKAEKHYQGCLLFPVFVPFRQEDWKETHPVRTPVCCQPDLRRGTNLLWLSIPTFTIYDLLSLSNSGQIIRTLDKGTIKYYKKYSICIIN